MGDNTDGFYVKLTTLSSPYSTPIVNFLQQLRLALMREFGSRTIDFDVHSMPLGPMDNGHGKTGGFVVTMAPIGVIKSGETWSDPKVNMATNRKSVEFEIPCNTIDSSTGKGNILAFGEDKYRACMEGRPALERLFDFNAVPGARRLVRSFLLTSWAYVDGVHGKAQSAPASKGEAVTSGPLFSSLRGSGGDNLVGNLL